MALWYVDGASSGGNGTTTATSGTNAAFKTITAALAGVAAGDTVNIQIGSTYTETPGGTILVNITVSGTAAAPITLMPYTATAGDWRPGLDFFTMGAGYTSRCFEMSTATYIRLLGAKIPLTPLNTYGIRGGDKQEIAYCWLTNTAGSASPAIQLNGNASVHHNLIEGAYTAYISNGSWSEIYQNIIRYSGVSAAPSTGYSGVIGISNAHDFGIIQNNLIYNLASGAVPSIGIVLTANSARNSIVRGNTVADVYGDGCYINDADQSNTTVCDNIFARCGGCGLNVSSTTMRWFRRFANNIIAQNGSAMSPYILDTSVGNDYSSDPFTGSTLAARLANAYALSTAAKNHAETLGDGSRTYPDLGAVQALVAAGGGVIVIDD